MKSIIIIALLITTSWCALAKDGAKVLAIHGNGKGIIINQGEDENIQVGDYGVFFLQRSIDFPQLTPVAEGKAVLVENNLSGWYLTKVYQQSLLIKRGTLLFIRGQDTLVGRAPWKFRQRKRVFTSQDKMKRKNTVIPEQMVIKANQHNTTVLLPTRSRTGRDEIITTNYALWKDQGVDKKGTKIKSIDQIGKVKDRNRVEEKIRDKILKNTTDSMVKKYNSLERGLYTLYRDQEMGGFIAKTKFSQPNVYEEYGRQNIDHLKKMSIQMIHLIKREGGRWSRNFKDEELRRELVNSGIVHKTREKQRLVEDQGNHEVVFNIHNSLTNHTVDSDSDQQGRGFHIHMGYEYHLQNIDRTLNHFAINAGLVSGSSFTAIDGRNARVQENRFTLGAKWYLKWGPQEIGKKLWYVGVGYSRGTARVYRSTNNAAHPLSWRADILSMPYYTIGFKYRYPAREDLHTLIPVGFGFNIGIIHEQYLLSPSSELSGNLIGTVITTNTKLLIGLSMFI